MEKSIWGWIAIKMGLLILPQNPVLSFVKWETGHLLKYLLPSTHINSKVPLPKASFIVFLTFE